MKRFNLGRTDWRESLEMPLFLLSLCICMACDVHKQMLQHHMKHWSILGNIYFSYLAVYFLSLLAKSKLHSVHPHTHIVQAGVSGAIDTSSFVPYRQSLV